MDSRLFTIQKELFLTNILPRLSPTQWLALRKTSKRLYSITNEFLFSSNTAFAIAFKKHWVKTLSPSYPTINNLDERYIWQFAKNPHTKVIYKVQALVAIAKQAKQKLVIHDDIVRTMLVNLLCADESVNKTEQDTLRIVLPQLSSSQIDTFYNYSFANLYSKKNKLCCAALGILIVIVGRLTVEQCDSLFKPCKNQLENKDNSVNLLASYMLQQVSCRMEFDPKRIYFNIAVSELASSNVTSVRASLLYLAAMNFIMTDEEVTSILKPVILKLIPREEAVQLAAWEVLDRLKSRLTLEQSLLVLEFMQGYLNDTRQGGYPIASLLNFTKFTSDQCTPLIETLCRLLQRDEVYTDEPKLKLIFSLTPKMLEKHILALLNLAYHKFNLPHYPYKDLTLKIIKKLTLKISSTQRTLLISEIKHKLNDNALLTKTRQLLVIRNLDAEFSPEERNTFFTLITNMSVDSELEFRIEAALTLAALVKTSLQAQQVYDYIFLTLIDATDKNFLRLMLALPVIIPLLESSQRDFIFDFLFKALSNKLHYIIHGSLIVFATLAPYLDATKTAKLIEQVMMILTLQDDINDIFKEVQNNALRLIIILLPKFTNEQRDILLAILTEKLDEKSNHTAVVLEVMDVLIALTPSMHKPLISPLLPILISNLTCSKPSIANRAEFIIIHWLLHNKCDMQDLVMLKIGNFPKNTLIQCVCDWLTEIANYTTQAQNVADNAKELPAACKINRV